MLYIELSERPDVNSQEVTLDVVFDFDEESYLIGIDPDHASKFINLSKLEVVALPIRVLTGENR